MKSKNNKSDPADVVLPEEQTEPVYYVHVRPSPKEAKPFIVCFGADLKHAGRVASWLAGTNPCTVEVRKSLLYGSKLVAIFKSK